MHNPELLGMETRKTMPQFDYIVWLAQLLEVSLNYLLLGEGSHKVPEFQINNKRLQELCKKITGTLQKG